MGSCKRDGLGHNGVADLPDLVWSLIIRQLLDSNISTLCSLSAVCRQLYILTVPILYQRINLDKNRGCPGLLLRLNAKDTKLPRFIRKITIESGNWINDVVAQQLLELFSKLTQLETLTWLKNYDIPDGILQSLHKYSPKSRLIVKADIPLSTSLEPHQCTGFSSPNLYRLDAYIPAEPQSKRIAKLSLFTILRSSKNLLILNTTQQIDLSGTFFVPELEVGLNIRENDELPQLEELSFPIFSVLDMSRWGNMGGWSKLKILKLGRKNARGIESFNGQVPCLRSLELEIPWSKLEDIERRLSQITTLEELVLTGDAMQFPFNLLAANSDTLRILSIHAPEPVAPRLRPDILISDITKLNKTCPNLKTLLVDINRNGQWPFEYLMELMKFQKLSHLTLMAEGTRGTGNPVLPVIDEDSGRSIFELLRRNKIGLIPLQYLKIQRGGKVRWGGGHPGVGARSEQAYRAAFEFYLDPSGNTVVTAKRNPTPQDLAEQIMTQRKEWNKARYADPLLKMTVEALSFLARRLDPQKAETELKSAGLIRDAVTPQEVEDIKHQGVEKIADSFVEFDVRRRHVNMEKLKMALVKKKRIEDMEKIFGRECTLYDLYCN